MTCERAGCTKRRSERAKFCGSRCRKLAFLDKKMAPVDLARDRPIDPKSSIFSDAVDPGAPEPTPAVRKIKGAKKYVQDKPAGPGKCPHFVPAGGRCVQKSCYGVTSKK